MQYLKEEIKNSILKQAEEEFFKKGFKYASLRAIAKNANTTLGNIYNYFKNKEAILDELVSKEYDFIKDFIKNHEQDEHTEEIWNLKNTAVLEQSINQVSDMLISVFSKRFYILFTCGETEKYKNIREEAEKLIGEHFLSDLGKFNKVFFTNKEIVGIIISQFIEGMLFISKKDSDDNTKKVLIKTFLMYTFYGIVGIIDYCKKEK